MAHKILARLATPRAQRVGFFNIGSGRVGYWTKYRVAGRVGSGRSVEIYDRVFPGIFFTLGYFRVCRVCRVFSGIYGYVGYLRVFTVIYGDIGYHLFFGGSEQNIKVFKGGELGDSQMQR